MLTSEGCRRRQERLRSTLSARGLAGAYLTDSREIQYLTGMQIDTAGVAAVFPAVLWIGATHGSWLACHTMEGSAEVDERLSYEPHLLYTMNPDPLRRLQQVAGERLAGGRTGGYVGYQTEHMPRAIAGTIEDAQLPDDWVAIDDDIAAMQLIKDGDEIALVRRSIRCTLAAYDAARQAITPGVNELEVQQAGHRAATLAAGEVVFHNGDYQCGTFGGFARDRRIESGELYIIDAWSRYRGYWSDLCRTFAVDETTAMQREVYAYIAETLAGVQEEIQPGRSGQDIWRWIDTKLRQHPLLHENGLVHHAGHGVGLRPHEGPDLNRDRGGLLEPGMVISVEPGGYDPALAAGIRLENTFLVTESGCELLSDYSLALE